jgi:hypothetical protein
MKLASRSIFAAALAFVALSASPANATSIVITAGFSDRGIDNFPRDGVFDGVFGNPSVVQVFAPPIGNPASEERTAVEFDLSAIATGSVITSVMLRISPQTGTNIGIDATEAGEVHGYAGNGAISVADLMVSNQVGALNGPSSPGQVTISLNLIWFQGLVDASSPFAGLMFKAVDGPTFVSYNFAGTFSGIPVANRPTLLIETEDSTVVPEPATLGLIGAGLVAVASRRRRQRSSPVGPAIR